MVWHGAAVRHIGLAAARRRWRRGARLVVGRPVVEEGGSVQRVFGLVALPCHVVRGAATRVGAGAREPAHPAKLLTVLDGADGR